MKPADPDFGIADLVDALAVLREWRRPLGGLTRPKYNHTVVIVQIAPPDFDRMFGALADHTRRDIVRRAAMGAEEGLTQAVGQIDAILAEDTIGRH